MGCGKSKHAVETATTVIKSSTNADGSKQTTATTKTTKETNESSLMQKQVETKSLSVEDTKKETATAEVDPSNVANTDNVAPTLGETVDEPTDVLKEDLEVKVSNKTDNVVSALTENAGKDTEVVTEDEKVKDLNTTDACAVNTNAVAPTSDVGTDSVVPASSKVDVGITEVVKEDEGKKESTQKADTKAKTDDLPIVEELKMKESNISKDNTTKAEFLTPTLSEDVVGPFEVAKGNVEVKDSTEKNIVTATSDEKPVKTNDGSSYTKDDNLKVEEKKLVALAVESTKVEANKDVEVTKVDISKAKTSPATETEQAPTASKANVEALEKKP